MSQRFAESSGTASVAASRRKLAGSEAGFGGAEVVRRNAHERLAAKDGFEFGEIVGRRSAHRAAGVDQEDVGLPAKPFDVAGAAGQAARLVRGAPAGRDPSGRVAAGHDDQRPARAARPAACQRGACQHAQQRENQFIRTGCYHFSLRRRGDAVRRAGNGPPPVFHPCRPSVR